MRKFVVSDIHGDGVFYHLIMNYLDQLSLSQEVSLYILGDLIDRGEDSFQVLMDVMKRIENNYYPITYLGGNHEQMMIDVYQRRIKGLSTNYNDWYYNGGFETDKKLNENLDRDNIIDLVNKISHLKLYDILDETFKKKKMILVHAGCHEDVKIPCRMEVQDDFNQTYSYLWTREEDPYLGFRCEINRSNYFAIVGHTPNEEHLGYQMHFSDNYLNIDSSLSDYKCLCEVNDEFFRILSFNQVGITAGSYLIDRQEIPFSKEELDKENKILVKKMGK